MNAAAPIRPLRGPLVGTVHVRGDKSISHRAVLMAAMAQGTSVLSGVLDSDDVRASMRAAACLGARVALAVQPDASLAGTIEGFGDAGPKEPASPIDCGNSGTTARLLLGIAAGAGIRVSLTGDESLRRRPMRRVSDPLERMGARIDLQDGSVLPAVVHPTLSLHGIDFESRIASAQVKTAVLLAGLNAAGTTRVREPFPSRNHTELMLPRFGVDVLDDGCGVSVTGPVVPRACALRVPGDPSSAAFLACAAALVPGSSVRIEGVSLNPGRTGFARVLASMGAAVEQSRFDDGEGEPAGAVRVSYAGPLHACEVPACSIATLIDEIPVLALVAAQARGTTVFRGVAELRVKESDRIAGIVDGLALLGVRAWSEGDDLYVEGRAAAASPSAVVLDARGDHRFAMTWAVAGMTGMAPVAVRGLGSVSVSYPGFFEDMRALEHPL